MWLWTCQDVEISYSTVHQLVRYELVGKLKTPRPSHEDQKPGVREVFKRYLPTKIEGIKADIREKLGNDTKISYWCQDETCLGFRTEMGQKITIRGVKPEQIVQWHYQSYYCYGLIEPLQGRSFFYEFSHFNSQLFGIYLEKFAQEYPDEVHIIQLDNAPNHTAKILNVPENIIFLFQPAYCPELNPIERLWLSLKQQLKHLWFDNLDNLKHRVSQILNNLSGNAIRSLTGWEYIIDALSL